MLLELLKKAATTLAPAGFDMEIVEKHHNQKLDAPSGTALALADSMNEALDEKYNYVYDRSQERKKREKYEIGISAVRGGNIVGEHEVIFAGQAHHNNRDYPLLVWHLLPNHQYFPFCTIPTP